jgi:splicing factor 3A subunit 1
MQTIDKLVRWILKSGRDFEKKVKERQRGDPRFDFLMPWNPYNAYYRQKLDDAFNGKLDDPSTASASAAAAAAAATAAAAADSSGGLGGANGALSAPSGSSC